MFLALKDIRFAKGRFALMTGVVTLVTLLLVLLSALTKGLGNQSTSAVQSLPATHVLLASSGGTTTWSDSVVTASQQRAAGADAQPLLIARARLDAGTTSSVAVFGTDEGTRAADTLGVQPSDTQVVLPAESTKGTSIATGSRVSLNGVTLTVVAVEPTRWYSHSPVAWTTRATAAKVGHTDPGQATALLLDGTDAQATAAAARSGLVDLHGGAIVQALPGYGSEHGSLLMIQGFLYGICALVVIAFLSVWTIQRTRDIAVLRAMGASRRYVLTDSLGQAAILLLIGAALGALVGTGIAMVARTAVPVSVVASTTLLPAVGVALIGALGAVIATRSVTKVDPLIALGGN